MAGEQTHRPGSVESNRAEFTRQAVSFGVSPVLGAPEQIEPLLEAARIGPLDRVLDVGCGTGFLLLEAAKLAAQVVGVDVTPAMLAQARRRVEEAGLANVTLREANAEALPFCGDRFDVVFARLMIHHCAHPQVVLSEMYRVCRPGGRLVLCDIAASDDPARAERHNRLERLRDSSHVQHCSAAALEQMVGEAGFTVVESRTWPVLRRFGEWTDLASVPPDVKPELAALLEAAIPGDGAGIQASRSGHGELIFIHHFLVVAGVK